MHCVSSAALALSQDVQFTEVAFAVPNLNTVAMVPGPKPVPVTVTLVVPPVGPPLGLTAATVGVNL